MVTLERQLFTEVFPIDTDNLPTLVAYRVVFAPGETAKVGGKLAYRLRHVFPGYWIWTYDRILTDTRPDPVKLAEAVDAIVRQEPKTYGAVVGLEEDSYWQPTPDALADFVARGPLDRLGDEMRAALAKTNFSLRNARVEREHRVDAVLLERGHRLLPGVSVDVGHGRDRTPPPSAPDASG